MRAWIRHSFRNRIFVTVLLITLLPLLLCDVIMMLAIVGRDENTMANRAETELDAVEESFDELLFNLTAISDELCDSTAVRSALRREGGESKLLYQVLYRKTAAMRETAEFEIYDREGVCRYSTGSVLPAQALSPGWGALYAAQCVEGVSFQAADGDGMIGAQAVRSYDGTVLGYVLSRVKQSGFDKVLTGVISPYSDILLVDGTWECVYGSQAGRAEATAALLREQLLSGAPLTGGETECRYTLRDSPHGGMSFILQQPRTYTSQVMTAMYSVSVTMGLLCLLLCLLCAWGLSRYLSKPVYELDAAMGQVEKGDYNVELVSASEDEMGRLTSSFNRMTREYRQNLDRSVQRERELNETRLSMLQAQLNPHFLYNTLDCIKWLGVTNHIPEVAEMATDLAILLRAGISDDKLITLERELELIERYISIQEIRFTDRFTLEVDIGEEFMRCMLPKLILQPLVENSIIHGVADMECGYIKLTAREENGDMIIAVSDNGRGLPPEVLEILASPDRHIPGGHLGLNNVDRIVRLYYGEEYGISAFSEPDMGSRVELCLPIHRNEQATRL